MPASIWPRHFGGSPGSTCTNRWPIISVRVARLMSEDKTILMMANHGVLAIGATIAAAFDELYYFERAAETLMTCYATGKELRIVSDAVARLTEQQWRGYGQLAVDHLENIKAILDVEEPSYRL